MPTYIPSIGIALHIVAFALFPFSTLGASIIGVLAAVSTIVSALKTTTALIIYCIIAAVVAATGWISWLIVALTSDPGDPVINVTGLLTVPGAILSIITLMAILLIQRRRARG